jgi:hypothetical protein
MFRHLFISFVLFIALIHVQTTFANTDVSQQLRECKKHLQANRLTTGDGGTAFECYQTVLKTDAKNAEALAGLEKIEARYVGWAKRALERGQKDKAKQFLTSLRLVNPDSLALAKLEAQLQPPSNKAPSTSSNESEKAYSSDKESSLSNNADSEKNSLPNGTEKEEASQSAEKPLPPKMVQIVDLGQIYELINTTDCLEWPKQEMKEKGGKNAWESYYPKKDETGLLVAEMQHCHFDNKVYLLQMDEYYVAISSFGAKIIEESNEEPQPSP